MDSPTEKDEANDVVMEMGNKTSRQRRSATPTTSDKLKEEITSYHQTPRRSGRRSIKPVQDYNEIITRSASRRNTYKDNEIIHEEAEELDGESKELNDHEQQTVAGQQTPSRRWTASEVGRSSQKRGRRGNTRKRANSTAKRSIVLKEENEEEYEKDEEKPLMVEQEIINDNQIEAVMESVFNENEEILELVSSEEVKDSDISNNSSNDKNQIGGNEGKSDQTLDKQEDKDKDEVDKINAEELGSSENCNEFKEKDLSEEDNLNIQEDYNTQQEDRTEIDVNVMENNESSHEQQIVVNNISTPEYIRTNSRRRRASNLIVLENIDITTPQIDKNVKKSKIQQLSSNEFDNDHELEVLSEDDEIEILEENELNNDEMEKVESDAAIVNDNNQHSSSNNQGGETMKSVKVLQNTEDNCNLDVSLDDMPSLILHVSDEEEDDQENENEQRCEVEIITEEKQGEQHSEQKIEKEMSTELEGEMILKKDDSFIVEKQVNTLNIDKQEESKHINEAIEESIIKPNSDEIIADKEENINSTFTLEDDNSKSASTSPEKENCISKKSQSKSDRKVQIKASHSCMSPKPTKKPIRVPTPYRTKVRDLDVLDQPVFLSSTKHDSLTTLQPNDTMRNMRKRSFSVCIDGQGAGGKIVKNVSLQSPTSDGTTIEQFDRVVEDNIKNKSFTIDTIETVTTKEADSNLKRNMFSCDDLSKVGINANEGHQKATETPSKSKSNAISKPWKFIATKLPNFASIHEKRFGKMENLVDYVARKQERSKNLLNSASKRNAGASSSRVAVDKVSNNKERKPPAARKINLADNNLTKNINNTNSNNRQIKQQEKVEKSRVPAVKKDTTSTVTGVGARNNNKQTIKSMQEKLGSDRAVKTPHYVFSSSLKANGKTATPIANKTAPIASAQQKQPQQKNANIDAAMTPDKSGIPLQDKMNSRLQRHMDLFKGRSNNHTANTNVRSHTDIIRGVRSNRRFDLQMQHRRNLQN